MMRVSLLQLKGNRMPIDLIFAPLALLLSNAPPAAEQSAADAYEKFKVAFTAKQYEDARGHAKVACDGGVFDGCYSLGKMLVDGLGGAVDMQQGRVYLHMACQSGLTGACYSFNATMQPR